MQASQFGEHLITDYLQHAFVALVRIIDLHVNIVVLRLQLGEGTGQIIASIIAILYLLQCIGQGLFEISTHRLLGNVGRLIMMIAALVLAKQAIIAGGYLACKAIVFEILVDVLATADGLVYDELVVLNVLLEILDADHLMILKAAHVFVRIIAAIAQKVGAIVATRYGLLLAFARGARYVLRFEIGQIQYIGHNIVAR